MREPRVVWLVASALLCAPAAALAEIPLHKQSFEDLSRRFGSAGPDTRLAIVEIWVKQREQKAIGLLTSALGADRSARVRTRAAFALGAMSAATSTAALRHAVVHDADGRVRNMAAWALGRMGSRDAVPELIRALSDADVSVRTQAAISLGQIGDRGRATEALAKALRDPARQVRTAATVALQKLGLPDSFIRERLPSEDRGRAIVAERKSQGAGFGLALIGAGLLYAGKPVAGWIVEGLFVAGIGMLAGGLAGDPFKTETVCPAPGPGGGCTVLPTTRRVNSGAFNLVLGGAILAGGAWLTGLVATPIVITRHNRRIDEARRARISVEPFIDLRADARVFGATLRF